MSIVQETNTPMPTSLPISVAEEIDLAYARHEAQHKYRDCAIVRMSGCLEDKNTKNTSCSALCLSCMVVCMGVGVGRNEFMFPIFRDAFFPSH